MKTRKKRWDAGLSKEMKAVGILWNWVCLGACVSVQRSDRWLKVLSEMEGELKRYAKEGCQCHKRGKGRG